MAVDSTAGKALGRQTGHRVGLRAEDFNRFQILQEARVSPNGAAVLYTISGVSEAMGQENSSLWLLHIGGNAPRRLTPNDGRVSCPRWRSDGLEFAFLWRGDGPGQVQRMLRGSSERRPFITLPQGITGDLEWSPDGGKLAFTAPQPTSRVEGAPYVVTRPIYRMDGVGYLDQAIADIYVVDAAGGEALRLTADGRDNRYPQWSPDGSEMLYLSATGPEDHDFAAELRIVDLHGNTRMIMPGWRVEGATWMADGVWLLVAAVDAGRPLGTKRDLFLVNSRDGRIECRTAGFPLGVGGFITHDMPVKWETEPLKIIFDKESNAALVATQEGGTIGISAFSVEGPEKVAAVLGGERSCVLQDLAGSVLLFVESTMNAPTELCSVDTRSGREQCLLSPNRDVMSWTSPDVQHLDLRGIDGVPMEGWLMTPQGGVAPHPTILNVHGGPHEAYGHRFMLDFQILTSAGYAVLFMNPRGSTGYGNGFANGIVGNWGIADYGDLMAGLDMVIAGGLVDPGRLGAYGLSGGGYLVCWMVGQTNRFKAAVAENPVTNWISFYGTSDIGPKFCEHEFGGKPYELQAKYVESSPITHAHKCKTPVLLIQGEADQRCPPGQSEEFYATLRASGCVVEMLRFPGGTHTASLDGPPIIRHAQNMALVGWFGRHIVL